MKTSPWVVVRLSPGGSIESILVRGVPVPPEQARIEYDAGTPVGELLGQQAFNPKSLLTAIAGTYPVLVSPRGDRPEHPSPPAGRVSRPLRRTSPVRHRAA